ncbi:hypothetical protein C2G38_2163740 [Gigaspora rosea]|uniref:Uncharacterized protein n=1 Tax=Gigaspora rosea TaxID=44941 RepID=A0A397W1W5_9GLOM|nr:hypothetical protein C2G38_2163740 [Gigaspora rosea]
MYRNWVFRLPHFFWRLWCESSGSSTFSFMVWVFGFLGFFYASFSVYGVNLQVSRFFHVYFSVYGVGLWASSTFILAFIVWVFRMFNEVVVVGVAVIGVADAIGTVANLPLVRCWKRQC